MIASLVRRSFIGLGFSAIVTFFVLSILMQYEDYVSVSMIWSNMLGSMIVGVYFGCSSLIFEIENWSPLKQTIVHYILSLAIWLPIAILTEWLPNELWAILIGVMSFTLIYLFTWYGHYLYFKKVENEMNEILKK